MTFWRRDSKPHRIDIAPLTDFQLKLVKYSET